jgi:hypothetical protein
VRYITIQSQTIEPDDDPEDGDIVALSLMDDDRCEKVWVLQGLGDPRVNEAVTDALGVERVYRKNLHRFDIKPPVDNPKALDTLIETIVAAGDLVEINPMHFSTSSVEGTNCD